MKNQIAILAVCVSWGLLLNQSAEAQRLVELFPKGVECKPLFNGCEKDFGPNYKFFSARNAGSTVSGGLKIDLICENQKALETADVKRDVKFEAKAVYLSAAQRETDEAKQLKLANAINGDVSLPKPTDSWCGTGRFLTLPLKLPVALRAGMRKLPCQDISSQRKRMWFLFVETILV